MLKLFIQALTDDCIQLILLIKSLLNQPQVIWIKGLPTRPQHIRLQAASSTHQSQHSFHHKTFSFHQNRCPIQAALNLHYLLKINNKLTAQSLNCYHYCICPRNGWVLSKTENNRVPSFNLIFYSKYIVQCTNY